MTQIGQIRILWTLDSYRMERFQSNYRHGSNIPLIRKICAAKTGGYSKTAILAPRYNKSHEQLFLFRAESDLNTANASHQILIAMIGDRYLISPNAYMKANIL